MIIESKYNIGDQLFYVHGFSYSFQVTCTCCSASGKVTTNDGKEIKCGECYGTGKHRVNKPYKIRPQKGKIIQIHYSTSDGIEYRLDIYPHKFKEAELMATFFESRQKAHHQNKIYDWPKLNFNRNENSSMPTLTFPDRCYWGVRLRKSLTNRNVE